MEKMDRARPATSAGMSHGPFSRASATREATLGKLLRDVFPLHTIRRIERELAAVGPDVEARIYRHALVNRGGERIVVNLALSPLSTSGGRSRGS